MLRSQEITDIITGCIQMRRQSQKEFYLYFYSYAMAVCMRYCKNEEDAIEILNDGFIKIFKELHAFVPRYAEVEAALKGWMKPIMVHTAIDHFRKNQRHKNHLSIENETVYLADNNESAIERMSYDELIRLIQQLSPMYRTVFNLYVIDGLKHEEISKKLNISVGTSKSNLAKARMNIQKMIPHKELSRYGKTAI